MKKFLLVSIYLLVLLLFPIKLSADGATSFNVDYSKEIVDPTTFYCYFVQPDGKSLYFFLSDYFFVDNEGKLHSQKDGIQRPNLNLDSLDVPSTATIDGKNYTVVGIANACFTNSNRMNIKKIILPKTVQYIDFYGFIENTSIEEVHGEGVTYVGDMAFYGDKKLKVVDLPNMKYASQRVFGNCSSLEKISLPNFIGPYKGTDNYQFFMSCTKLKEIDCPKLECLIEQEFTADTCLKRFIFPSVKTIEYKRYGGSGIFYGVTNRVNCVYLPNLETPVEIGTFSSSNQSSPKSIDTLIIPKVKTFQPYNISGFKYLDIRSVVVDSIIHKWPGTLHDNVINHIVCHDTEILKWLNIMQDKNYSIQNDDRPYRTEGYDYPGFETVELTNQTEMVDTAFMHIPNVKHLVLHKGCTAYNPKAFFTYLKGLQDITVKADNEVFKDHHGVLYSKDDKLLYYPLCNETTNDSLGNDRPWDLLNYKTTGVGPYALYKYVGKDPKVEENGHHEIHISNGNECEIGEHAMDGSTVDHVTFDLDAPLTSVGDYAFANMTEPCFRYLKMPRALTTVGKCAFANEPQLEALELYNTALTSVGDSAFAGQTTITSIALPNTVTTIGNSAFKGNSGMKYFTMPKACTTIGDEAFSGCSADMVIKMPETTVTSEQLGKAFASADTKPHLLMPKEKQADFAGWTLDEETKTVTVPSNRYISFTRSYPVAIDTVKAPKTMFYRAIGIKDKRNDKGEYVVNLKRLYGKDLQLVPANSTILMYFDNVDEEGNKIAGQESFDYTICANTNDKIFGDSPVIAAPGAIRLDQTEVDGEKYTNFVLDSSDSNTGTYNLVTENPWYDVATRQGEKSYLHITGYDIAACAKGIVFDIVNNSATGISSIKGNGKDNNLWFDLSGKSTAKPSHGVYIHNGKKVIVK